MRVNNHLIFKTHFGDAAVIYCEKPFSMIKTFLPRADGKSPVESLSKTERGNAGLHSKALKVSESIIDYFKGKPLRVPWKWMDLCDLTELQKTVLAAVADIPYGKVRAYKDIAETIGRPGASRFVGTTVAKNPFPILIPCHRVIRSDGSIGQFGGGPELKRKMIALESKYAGKD